ncbi:general odorant-binding protein 72-like [Aethina tumida]|uniref:general odorant-binding protein 72-like n=1 Tax=Aethina tumida TaxID=116153 RepID=UPI00214741D0|nr:general odorant-binding protein 72-like [Aethina tumida]
MKLIFAYLVSALLVHHGQSAMSEQQLKAAIKLMRNVCQPKSKATDEQIAAMHEGNFDQGKPIQCYNWCLLNMYKLIRKDNSFDWEGGLKTLEAQAPPRIVGPATKCITQCKDAVKTTSDKCAAGNEITECLYKCDPPNYFLP